MIHKKYLDWNVGLQYSADGVTFISVDLTSQFNSNLVVTGRYFKVILAAAAIPIDDTGARLALAHIERISLKLESA